MTEALSPGTKYSQSLNSKSSRRGILTGVVDGYMATTPHSSQVDQIFLNLKSKSENVRTQAAKDLRDYVSFLSRDQKRVKLTLEFSLRQLVQRCHLMLRRNYGKTALRASYLT